MSSNRIAPRHTSWHPGATREISWSPEREAHIARHGVSPGEVEDVCYTRPRWTTAGRNGTTLVFGTTDPCRYLLVVPAEAVDGRHLVVTARDLTDSERHTFRRKGR